MSTSYGGLRRESDRILTLYDKNIDINKKRREAARMNMDETWSKAISPGLGLSKPIFPLLFSACVFCSPVRKYIYL